MDQQPEAKTNRVEIGDLPRQEKQLKEKEAENVKGGGGCSGGVIDQRPGGEEIPQKKQN